MLLNNIGSLFQAVDKEILFRNKVLKAFFVTSAV